MSNGGVLDRRCLARGLVTRAARRDPGPVDLSSEGPPRVELARLPTPLQPLDRLRAVVGGPRIWLKRDDLTEGAAGGNKLRKLEFAIGQALAEEADVVITAGASQSNHCRQTAFAAARFGLRCHLVLAGPAPASAPDGNLLLDELFAAEITYVDPDVFDDLAPVFEQVSDQHRREGSTPFCIPVGASDEIGLWGYVEAAAELAGDVERLAIDPTHLVAAVGSGGTHAGLLVGAERAGLAAQVLGISVSRSTETLLERTPDLVDRWNRRYGQAVEVDEHRSVIVDDYIAPGYGRAEARVYETIRLLGRLEGVVFDPVYTGKAFDGLLREIEAGRFDGSDDIVFVHTGGIFAVFPHRDRFPR